MPILYELPSAVRLLLVGREHEIENTEENRIALTRALYYAEFEGVLDEVQKQRARKVLASIYHARRRDDDSFPSPLK